MVAELLLMVTGNGIANSSQQCKKCGHCVSWGYTGQLATWELHKCNLLCLEMLTSSLLEPRTPWNAEVAGMLWPPLFSNLRLAIWDLEVEQKHHVNFLPVCTTVLFSKDWWQPWLHFVSCRWEASRSSSEKRALIGGFRIPNNFRSCPGVGILSHPALGEMLQTSGCADIASAAVPVTNALPELPGSFSISNPHIVWNNGLKWPWTI